MGGCSGAPSGVPASPRDPPTGEAVEIVGGAVGNAGCPCATTSPHESVVATSAPMTSLGRAGDPGRLQSVSGRAMLPTELLGLAEEFGPRSKAPTPPE